MTLRAPICTVWVLLAGLVAAGCGYRLVRAEDGPTVRLGSIDDASAEGDLGLWARDHLRRRLLVRTDAPIELRGRIGPGDDRPVALATAGERVGAVGVVVELTAVDARGTPLASSGPVARSRPLAAVADPTGAQRRARVIEALGDALERITSRLEARP